MHVHTLDCPGHVGNIMIISSENIKTQQVGVNPAEVVTPEVALTVAAL